MTVYPFTPRRPLRAARVRAPSVAQLQTTYTLQDYGRHKPWPNAALEALCVRQPYLPMLLSISQTPACHLWGLWRDDEPRLAFVQEGRCPGSGWIVNCIQPDFCLDPGGVEFLIRADLPEDGCLLSRQGPWLTGLRITTE